MTVKELIKLLETCPQDAQVILSSDGEGNSFSPLSDHSDDTYYFPDSTWSGDVWSEENLIDDEMEYSEGDRCVVLWPTN